MNRRAMKRALELASVLFLASASAAAAGGPERPVPSERQVLQAQRGLIDSALGVPCLPMLEVRMCPGTALTLVESFDGVPLDVDVYLPPASMPGPYPLIVNLHGFGVTKLGAFLDNDDETPGPLQAMEWARQGYAVLAYSARGIGFSCGLAAVRDITPGCANGHIHLADARYEGRDTQHLAGLMVDEGLVRPKRIGVTGTSYGGGQSLMLATLRDRMMLPSGKLVPFRSPEGVPMQIAAAAPRIGWSDLPSALVPNGTLIDYRARNAYKRFGSVKFSYLNGLYAVAQTGFVAPTGSDPDADLNTWKSMLDQGEPFEDNGVLPHALDELSTYHSGYGLLRKRSRSWRAPAPIVAYSGWTDDIMPPHEMLRYRNLLAKRFPRARMGVIFSAEFAHNRGSLGGAPNLHNDARDALFDRYLMGNRATRTLSGFETQTVGCAGQAVQGPFVTRSWRGQHPGEVRERWRRARSFGSAGGSAATSLLTDPFAGVTECPATSSAVDPGAATFTARPATGDGYTLLGSPTIDARIRVAGDYPQITARLWDVAPDGSQTMVQHSPYRPAMRGRQVFQMQPAGWHFAAGHRPRLELLGRDFPYMQPSTGTFQIKFRKVRMELPVRQRADGDQVMRLTPPRLP